MRSFRTFQDPQDILGRCVVLFSVCLLFCSFSIILMFLLFFFACFFCLFFWFVCCLDWMLKWSAVFFICAWFTWGITFKKCIFVFLSFSPRRLKELSLAKCPALKALPNTSTCRTVCDFIFDWFAFWLFRLCLNIIFFLTYKLLAYVS